MRLKPVLCLALALLLCGCGAGSGGSAAAQAAQKTAPAAESLQEAADDPAASLLQGMTLRQKVGQLFIVRPDALDPTQTQAQINDAHASGVTAVTEGMRAMLAQYPVGGVCLFGKNLAGPEQTAALNAELQAASALPLFVAVDEEGGAVSRLANHPAFDLPRYGSAAAVGASGDPAQAQAMGAVIGAYLRGCGFNMDFAPVADVNTNPNNPVIGERAFSSDAAVAAAMAAAMARGLYGELVIPTFKHFPGHGDTAEDSHTGQAVTLRTREEMERCEFLPFAAQSDAVGAHAVMVGHITAPALCGNDLPASLSPQVVEEILRGELGQTDLIVTDSLSMQAITDRYSPGEAAVLALQAGCDLLLMPDGLAEAYEAVLDAVADGSLTEARIDESVHRILTMKREFAILDPAQSEAQRGAHQALLARQDS